MKRIIAVLLAVLMLSGCGGTSTDLMEAYIPRVVEENDLTPRENPADFAVSLFQNSVRDGGNTLISPLSVLSALAMTANGAGGETLTQMEAVLGATPDQLNSWFHSYLSAQKGDEALHLANGIWFNTHERFTANHDFLQTNADYFGAGVYAAPFDDATLRDINDWVSRNTDGMIDGILDEIPEEAVMYLVNALSFEAQWADVYEENQVRPGTFTTEDGRKLEVELMYDTLYSYLETENATGFIRRYAGNDYAFAALLPNEGISVMELAESLDGAGLTALLTQPQQIAVETAIPKFEAESALDMNEILMNMGMTDAFDPDRADLTGLGTSAAGNIHISRVLHKTFISVAEKGTRAGAATMIEATDRAMIPMDVRTVYLNRPFVYMLIDCQTGLPIFMGTCMEIGG